MPATVVVGNDEPTTAGDRDKEAALGLEVPAYACEGLDDLSLRIACRRVVQLAHRAGLHDAVPLVAEQQMDGALVAVASGDHEVKHIVGETGVSQRPGKPAFWEVFECHDTEPADNGSLQLGCPQGNVRPFCGGEARVESCASTAPVASRGTIVAL